MSCIWQGNKRQSKRLAQTRERSTACATITRRLTTGTRGDAHPHALTVARLRSVTPADGPDPYFKKRVQLSLEREGETLQFEVAHTLFASHSVNAGSRLLLRSLELERPPARILDLGCGYGVLGIALARRFPDAQVTMADSNLLAVRYANRNALLNGAMNAEAVGSVGLEGVPAGKFDLIVSNVPAKIGDEAIAREFVRGPRERLAAGGEYWFVAVSGLNHLFKRLAGQDREPLRQVRKRSGHAVYRVTGE